MQVAIGLYQGVTALDFVGPYQVLSNRPDTEVVLCAAEAGIVADDNDILHLQVDRTFADVPSPDVLLVPGGFVTRRMAAEGHPIVDWVRSAHPTTTWTTSVCTGALVLGLCLLVARRAGHVLLPLVAAGSMTLTLYSAHLLGLFLELHYEQPVLWFLVHVLVGAVFAVLWHRARGQGPLERVVGRAARAGRDRVLRHRLNS